MKFDVVCISRTYGARGEEVGRIVAHQLGFTYVDEEIVTQAAQKGGVDPATVADAETRKSLLSRLIEDLGEGGAVEAYAYAGLIPSVAQESGNAGDVRSLIREAVRETASEGRVVIVAHAASHALVGVPEVLRVLVTASPDVRAERVAEDEELSDRDAKRKVRDADRARADYLKRFYEIEDELPTHYDLVVSTDALVPSQVADIVVAAAS
jgi:hypothetical protein